MNVANDDNNNLISAELSVKGTTYRCPNCKEIVVLAGGGTQRIHFRHKVGGKYEACELFVKGLESEVNNEIALNEKGNFSDQQQREIYENNNILFINEMKNLVEEVDYSILSYQIEDFERKKIPVLRFCNLNQEDFTEFSKEKILEYIRGRGLKYKALWKICNYPSIEKKIFKVKHSDVDINAAIDVGFGVLKLHKGNYAGQKFMFDPLLIDGNLNSRLGLYILATERLEN